MSHIIPRPDPSEYAPYFAGYISLVPPSNGVDNAMAVIEGQLEQTVPILRSIREERSLHRWTDGAAAHVVKWSVKENLGHITDTERIMTYRLLCIARGDQTPFPGFEQDDYVRNANFDAIAWQDLVTEFAAVRRATILLLRSLTPEALARVGTCSSHATSARALAWVIAGHLIHHMRLLKEKYEVV